MKIKVNVPKGFVARYEWIDGDLVISVEPIAPVRITKGTSKHPVIKGYIRQATQKGRATQAGRGPLVVTVETDKKPTVARKGTGSTGPRDKDNG
ncbi:hypothetical protein LIS66_19975 [Pseudomonas sp. HN2]|uniref:hypothetical protein n=1 Tax=Pseudomonas sp. HN2 TaxID=2884805 RepID=UPI001D150FAA|nr:hypothetical protein [Pseudomonas sp. HN2]UEB94640.1 hypothetical protein LIS66_19975 [Pseudomonas sp. HN2]